MKTKTVGVSPKLIAAVVTAALTYVLGQEVLELPAWAVVLGQVLLVSIAAYMAGAGNVTTEDSDVGRARFADERGLTEPLTLLIYVVVLIVVVIFLFELLDRV